VSTYTTSHAFLDALSASGVSHIFANFGSDHPALLEAIAEARASQQPIPRVITCPHEFVAMSAAHGFYQASGIAQAVVVHVDCGTQSLAGALHNAAKGRIPMLLYAGASPFTQEGELRGSRNEFIQWIQDVRDQRGIVRGYVKHDNEIRTGANVRDLVRRALQIACSDPKGPAYLMGAREVMEQETSPPSKAQRAWTVLAPGALPSDGAREIARALIGARRPLIVTSYVGRNPAAVPALVRLCHRLGIGVLESVPSYMNYPHDDECYRGNQWNQQAQNAALAEADVVLVIDSDVPWIPTVSRPSPDAAIFHIDVDPLKEQMPLWHVDAISFRVDGATALGQIEACLASESIDESIVAERRRHLHAAYAARTAMLQSREAAPAGGGITSEYLMSCLREVLDHDTIVLNETITNYHVIFDHLRMSRPGSMFASGGGSLGWNGGAAIGVKLAKPDATVVAVTGDGSYMCSLRRGVPPDRAQQRRMERAALLGAERASGRLRQPGGVARLVVRARAGLRRHRGRLGWRRALPRRARG
jgi:acetolactate synthase I/II/III large subunit